MVRSLRQGSAASLTTLFSVGNGTGRVLSGFLSDLLCRRLGYARAFVCFMCACVCAYMRVIYVCVRVCMRACAFGNFICRHHAIEKIAASSVCVCNFFLHFVSFSFFFNLSLFFSQPRPLALALACLIMCGAHTLVLIVYTHILYIYMLFFI